MKRCVFTFDPRSGTGVQIVSGIVDAEDGLPFVPALVIFQSGFAPINTVVSDADPIDAYADFHGADNAVDPVADTKADCLGVGVAKFWGGFATPTGGSQASLLDHDAAGGGGVTWRRATITAVASGSFALTYTVNARTGDTVLCTVLGGDDLVIDQHEGLTNEVVVTTGAAQGVLMMSHTFTAGSGWGWDTRDSDRGASVAIVINQGGNGRYQRSNTCGPWLSSTLGGDPVLDAGAPVVSAWGALDYTVTGNLVAIKPYTQFAFSGTDLVAKAGSFLQQAGIGQQPIALGFAAKWIMFVSRGAAAGTTLLDDQAETAHGWTDGTNQVGFWAGENTVGNVGSVNGARYLSNDSLLRFATPAGSLTTFDAVASFVSLADDGTLVIDWTTNDDVPREILWFALGAASPTPPEPPVTLTRRTRRLRRFPLPFDRSFAMLLSRLELLIQSGQGLPSTSGQGSDPLISVRFSPDGGRTWGYLLTISAGKQGDFDLRPVINRIGKLRNGLCEVVVTDPIYWYLLDCFVTATETGS